MPVKTVAVGKVVSFGRRRNVPASSSAGLMLRTPMQYVCVSVRFWKDTNESWVVTFMLIASTNFGSVFAGNTVVASQVARSWNSSNLYCCVSQFVLVVLT